MTTDMEVKATRDRDRPDVGSRQVSLNGSESARWGGADLESAVLKLHGRGSNCPTLCSTHLSGIVAWSSPRFVQVARPEGARRNHPNGHRTRECRRCELGIMKEHSPRLRDHLDESVDRTIESYKNSSAGLRKLRRERIIDERNNILLVHVGCL